EMYNAFHIPCLSAILVNVGWWRSEHSVHYDLISKKMNVAFPPANFADINDMTIRAHPQSLTMHNAQLHHLSERGSRHDLTNMKTRKKSEIDIFQLSDYYQLPSQFWKPRLNNLAWDI